jgi:hypothetical protein
MGFTRVIDSTADPVLEVQFEVAPDHPLSVWVRAERKPDIWAKQSLVRHAPADWRLSDPRRADWQNFAGEKTTVPKKLMERPGLDSQLKRIGPALAQLRHLAAESDGGLCEAAHDLLQAIDRAYFGARSSRGCGPPLLDGSQPRYRNKAREGRTRAPSVARQGRELVSFSRSSRSDSDIFLILY